MTPPCDGIEWLGLRETRAGNRLNPIAWYAPPRNREKSGRDAFFDLLILSTDANDIINALLRCCCCTLTEAAQVTDKLRGRPCCSDTAVVVIHHVPFQFRSSQKQQKKILVPQKYERLILNRFYHTACLVIKNVSHIC